MIMDKSWRFSEAAASFGTVDLLVRSAVNQQQSQQQSQQQHSQEQSQQQQPQQQQPYWRKWIPKLSAPSLLPPGRLRRVKQGIMKGHAAQVHCEPLFMDSWECSRLCHVNTSAHAQKLISYAPTCTFTGICTRSHTYIAPSPVTYDLQTGLATCYIITCHQGCVAH